ncbi:MAG: hypothetical protein ACOYD7_06210 [Raoultibacter sp.]|jgi:hypothetical protein
MGFFGNILRKAQGLPTDSEVAQSLDNLKAQIAAMNALADSLDAINSDADDVNLGMALRLDMMNFALHIASSDGVLEPSEVDAINLFWATTSHTPNARQQLRLSA